MLCSNCAQCAVPAATAVSAVLVQNPPDKTMIQNNTVAVCIFWKYICFEIKYILCLAKHFQPSQDSSAPMTITLYMLILVCLQIEAAVPQGQGSSLSIGIAMGHAVHRMGALLKNRALNWPGHCSKPMQHCTTEGLIQALWTHVRHIHSLNTQTEHKKGFCIHTTTPITMPLSFAIMWCN